MAQRGKTIGRSADLPTLAAFVPTRLAARVQESTQDARDLGHVEARGATLLLDISGFSRLASEWTLADGVGGGADRLSRMLIAFFGRHVEIVDQHDGDLIRFAGDALLVTWIDLDDAEAVTAALACAREMLELVATMGPIEGTVVAARVAIGLGELQMCRVGGPERGWDVLVYGPGIRDLDAPLAAALPGELRMSSAATAAVQGATVVTRRSPARAAPKLLHEAYVPRWIRDQIDGGATTWMAQLRTVTCAYVHLGEARDDRQWAARMHRLVRGLRDAVLQWGGVQTQVVVDDKGPVWIGVFGLVPGPREYRPRDALSWAQAAARELRVEGVPLHIGLTTGQIFSGTIGAPSRLEVGIVGSRINLAARMANQGPAGIYVDESTAASAQFQGLERLGELAFKGFDRPVCVYTFDETLGASPTEARGSRARLVGRRPIIEAILAGLDEGRRYQLRAVAGAGKTRIGAEIARRARESGHTVVWLEGDPIQRGAALHAWSRALDEVLELPSEAGARRRGLEARCAERGLAASAALALAPLVGLSNEVADPADPADPSLGARRLDAIGPLLAQLLEGQSVAMVIDDVQWLDSSSAVLAAELLRETGAFALLLRRSEFGDLDPALANLVRDDDELELERLEPEAVDALARELLDVERVPARLLDWLEARCSGNPFYIREELAALRTAGLAELEGRVVILADATELDLHAHPPTVVGSVAWRLDRLGEDTRSLITAASVLGMSFELPALARMRPELEDLPALAQELVELELWGPDKAGYRFSHRTVLDVAYASLIREHKAALHGTAATLLGEVHAPPALIAHHLAQTKDPVRALPWFEAGAKAALEAGATREAFGLLGEALELDRRLPTLTLLERTHFHQRRAASASRLGLVEPCIEEASKALELLGQPLPSSQKQWRRRLFAQLLVQLRYRLLPRRSSSIDPALVEAGLAWSHFAEGAFFAAGGPLEFITGLVSTANLAERSGRKDIGVGPWGELSQIATLLGLRGLAKTYIELAQRMGKDSPDVMIQLRLALSVHGYLCAQSSWTEADALMEHIHLLALEPSTSSFAPFALYRDAGFEVLRGRPEALMKIASALEEIAHRTGSQRCRSWSRNAEGSAHLALGELEPAIERTALVLGDPGAVDPFTPLIARATHTRALTRAGRLEEALGHARVLADAGPSTPMASITRHGIFLAPLELALARLEQGLDTPGLEPRASLALASKYVSRFRACAPLVAGLEARLLDLEGRRGAARATLSKAMTQAQAQHLTFVVEELERARERLELRDPPP